MEGVSCLCKLQCKGAGVRKTRVYIGNRCHAGVKRKPTESDTLKPKSKNNNQITTKQFFIISTSKTDGLVRDVLAPNRLTDKSYSLIVEVLKIFNQNHPNLSSGINFIYMPGKLPSLFANFEADLKRLLEDCNFDATLEIMIQDRILCWINEEKIQRRFLSESDLTFQRAFEIAQGMEATQRYVTELRYQSQSGRRKQEVWYTNRRVKMSRRIGDHQESVANVIIVEENVSRTSTFTKG